MFLGPGPGPDPGPDPGFGPGCLSLIKSNENTSESSSTAFNSNPGMFALLRISSL